MRMRGEEKFLPIIPLNGGSDTPESRVNLLQKSVHL
jgi:hypothetical protein